MKKKIIGICILLVIIAILTGIFLTIKNTEIPDNYIAYIPYPHGQGTRVIYIYYSYNDFKSNTEYSYIEDTKNDYRETKMNILRKGKLKNIDEVISFIDDYVILNINTKIKETDGTIKKEFKKGDIVSAMDFKEILQAEKFSQIMN